MFQLMSLVIFDAIAGEARGVGHDEYSVTAVRGTNGCRWYAVPFRVIPDRGQVTDDIVKPKSKQCCDVLQQNCLRSKYANESRNLGPQPSLVCLREPLACDADWLARESPGQYVHTGSALTKISHVVVAGDTRPVLGKDSLAELVPLAEPCGAESNAPKSKVNASDACEQAPNGWSVICVPRFSLVLRALQHYTHP